MRRHLFVFAGFVGTCAIGAVVWACSGGSSGNGGTMEAGPETGLTLTLNIPCADMQTQIYSAPGTLQSLNKVANGTVLHCFDNGALALPDLNKIVKGGSPGYQGTDLTSGAHVYDILYVTQRGDAAASLGWSTAAVFVPDTPRAVPLPVIAAVHANTGAAQKCTPSKAPLKTIGTQFWGYDYAHLVMPLVGAGYIVVVPDFPGYAGYDQIGNPPQAYAGAWDMAFSTIDAIRAVINMFGSGVMSGDGGTSSKLALVGDGIGANGALAAAGLQANRQNPYAGELGKFSAIALYDPLWISQRVNAAYFMGGGDGGGGIDSNGPGTLSVWYHYTHGELMDGVGHGSDVFSEAGAPLVKKFVDNECVAFQYPELVDAGMTVDDIFDPNYAADILAAVSEGGTCDMAMDPDTCNKWLTRFDNDRPHIAGVTTPVFIAYGGHDPILTPDWAKCVFDRLRADLVKFDVCYDSTANGASIVSTEASYVNDWLAFKTMGGDDPGPCQAQDEMALKATCNQLVPNN